MTQTAAQKGQFIRCQYACYLTSFSTAATGNLSPLLFLTFRAQYGLSYTLLGLLILVNFSTQLLLDLVFSFASQHICLTRAVKATPAIMAAGMVCFAVLPILLPEHVYLGLLLGTIFFSAGSGLNEVLTSPTIAAIPSDNNERMMSRLHSCYAWGVVVVVVISSAFLYCIGGVYWQWLTVFFALFPTCAVLLFLGAPMPPLTAGGASGERKVSLRDRNLLLCVLCIFLGGASECTMSQWCSGFLEQALGIPKLTGDLAGVAVFGAMLGLGRSLYGHFGKNISKILLIGSLGAMVCYLTAVVTTNPVLALTACALTGLCVSMLWPGSLMMMEERLPGSGVGIYALMAAGGDLGASVVPQMVGIIADWIIAAPAVLPILQKLSLTPEQAAIKAGLAFAALFPLGTAVIVMILNKYEKKQ